MTNEKIFKKAIEKVIKNGWKGVNPLEIKIEPHDKTIPRDIIDVMSWITAQPYIIELIFFPDFAKALWGEEWQEGDCIKQSADEMFLRPPSRWKYYQHQMLDEIQEGKDPIKYLEQFIK